MGKLKYTVDEFDKKFYMFAIANVNPLMEIYNIRYYYNLFAHIFKSLEVPKYIGIAPDAYYESYAKHCEKSKKCRRIYT